MIGQGHGSHPLLTGEGKELVKTNSSVQEAILAVEMKMDKFFHVQFISMMGYIAQQSAP
jgi:hypothetical protein